jgi:hypothetical protein
MNVKSFFKDNGLSLVLFGIFGVLLIAQSVTGYLRHNDEQREHNQPPITYSAYLQSGDFLESIGENWESEFLQMAVYVLFTVYLYQRGSAESKSIGESESVDKEPRSHPNAPWPVRKGGMILKIYEYSLTLAMVFLFFISFGLHATGGAAAYCEEQQQHSEKDCPSAIQYLGTSRFWFESFQNWQSEFLAVGSIVVLSIFLRQKGSPESKPVDAPHHETG